MAFSNSTSDRMDELRFRSQNGNESPLPLSSLTSPIRNGSRLPPPPLSTHDGGRVSLVRRFTTDSGRVPTVTSIANQRAIQAPESLDFPPSTLHKVQLLEKKKIEYERLREQKRRFESEMQLLDLQQRREEQELQQMQEELVRTSSNNHNNNKTHNGHQSEPSTPPEYRETSSGFPSVFSRPNRYSTSSITSPPGLYNRPGRSGSQLTSPQSGIMPSRLIMDEVFSPHSSVPGSRPSSDDDDKQEAVRQDPTSYRSSNTSNRYSMPVTKSRNPIQDLMDHDLDQTNTEGFLFGDEEPRSAIDNYLEKGSNKDHFPILVNRNGMNLSASHKALDLAIDPSASPEPQSYPFAPYSRHRPSHSSTANGLTALQLLAGQGNTKSTSQSNVATANLQNGRNPYRSSVDMSYMDAEQDAMAALTSPKHVQATPPKLQSSYSTNDVPTMKNGSGDARNYSLSTAMSPNSHAQQYLHQHNANTGRYPPNGVNNRHSRELSVGESASLRESQGNSMPSIQSALHASAPPFSLQRSQQPQSPPSVYPQYANPYAPAFEGAAYMQNMQMLSGTMQNMQMGPPPVPDMRLAQTNYNAQAGYNSQLYPGYSMYPSGAMQHHSISSSNSGYSRGHDSQARVMESRRKQDGEKMAQFKGATIHTIQGDIYRLCKDQYGCRFLQQIIDTNNPETVLAIWGETAEHVVELMMDPFGNYLCQKLFELCNDPERTALIQNAAKGQNMFNIAVSPHGTRALQKMIEFAHLPEQRAIIITALQSRVVELIQDLNGNHVVQKCLTKFTPADSQFIFDAVADQCVEVGTHRHGCCVLQRCIDHAKEGQKTDLISAITSNSRQLVQDAFGNYVIQYILDLHEDIYTEAIVMTFRDQVQMLSTQKFSSNVIEKCIRTAPPDAKKMIVDELIQPNVLRVCATDSFANYVIQTALDHTEGELRHRLIEAIRPLLPTIRNQPCGRRIQSKMDGDSRKVMQNGSTPPLSVEGQATLPRLQNHHGRGNSNNSNYLVYGGANGYSRNGSYQAPRQIANGAAQLNGHEGPGSQELALSYRGSLGGGGPGGPMGPPNGSFF